MSKRAIRRREFLRLSMASAAGAVLAACAPTAPAAEPIVEAPPAAPPAAPAEPTTPDRYSEAPFFADRSASGAIPPVAERLPLEPAIVVPYERVGDYGGTLHVTTIRAENYGDDTVLMGCEGLLRTDTDGSTVAANIAKAWEFNEDGTEMTLYLREGMRWSDGEPLTADDIMHWYEDVFLNKDLTPTIGRFWRPGPGSGTPIVVEKVDDFSVKFISAVPNPEILSFGGPIRGDGIPRPKHFLEQFHPTYTDVAEIEKQAKAAGYDYWYQLYNYKNGQVWGTPIRLEGRPTLCAYVITEMSTAQRVYERNPYYWKVDTAGHQLPYFDKVSVQIISDREMVNAQLIGGNVDIAVQETAMENYPLYQESADQAQLKVNIWKSVLGADVIYQPSLTYGADPVLRDIFRDLRFRQALSLAIDRNEVNEVLYFGMGTPRQFTVIPESGYFKQEYADAYAEFDPARANELLDEMGLEWDADKKVRVRPDGRPLSWTIEFFPIETPKRPTTELIVEYWRDIGCDVQFKEISGELTSERYTGNLVEMGLWHGDKVTDVLFSVSPQFLVPYNVGWETTWGVEWARWLTTEGREGEEPPQEIMDLFDAWDELKQTMDPAKRIEVGRRILDSQAKNLWVIGVVGLTPKPVITKTNVRNFPEEGLHGWDVVWTCYKHPEQFFFEGGKSLIG